MYCYFMFFKCAVKKNKLRSHICMKSNQILFHLQKFLKNTIEKIKKIFPIPEETRISKNTKVVF